MQKVDFSVRRPLYGVIATRTLERSAQSRLPAHTLMQRAGLSVAQLALAIAPHSRRIWIACGPGNNGGDGLEAAMHLQRWGKSVFVTWLGKPEEAPQDAATSFRRAREAGVSLVDSPPPDRDLCIDALLGIGAHRAPAGRMAEWIIAMNQSPTPVLSVDIPTGLHADTGAIASPAVWATHTLSVLTLKPGLFTNHGRDASGVIWFDDLGCDFNRFAKPDSNPTPDAWLAAPPQPAKRLHASHKGSYGDVTVVGGAKGMTGAALLAASAALHGGAGRVFVSLLEKDGMSVDSSRPELMFRALDSMDFSETTVVCGCGGGDAILPHISGILSTSALAVIDADAINVIALTPALQELLTARSRRHADTVLTPHPLEAARLLGVSTAQVQNDRLDAALQLARRYDCTVVLKGSGTVIAAPKRTSVINPTGNALLATGGTGDVLAGMIGAKLASGEPAFDAACSAVFHHGWLADHWPSGTPLVAADLATGQTFRS